MMTSYLPPTQEIHELFLEEVSAMGCAQPDVADDGAVLYARAFFSAPVEIRPRDAVQGGVAVRAFGEFIDVHPFVYRQVCTNGAIVADALESRRVERVSMAAPTVAINAVLAATRLAIRGCGHPASFEHAVDGMRRATQHQGVELMDLVLTFGFGRGIPPALLDEAVQRFTTGGDPTTWGMMNAITSVARDARTLVDRWQLEKLGGGMLALLHKRVKRPGGATVADEELVDVCA